jgi:hypothetical protein
VNIENRLYALRRLEIELLLHYQTLCKKDAAIGSVMLDTGFDMVNWLVSVDHELIKDRLLTFFKCNRSSIFKVNAILNIGQTTNQLSVNQTSPIQTSPIHSAIKTTERKIIATIREIAAHNLDLAYLLCGISKNDAFALRNTEIDVVEDWVYRSNTRGILSLKISNKRDAEHLFSIDRISIASIYLDKIGM